MHLSKAALLCLEMNPVLKEDILCMKSAVLYTSADRRSNSEYFTMRERLRRNPEEFFEYFSMSVKVFDYILDRIQGRLGGVTFNGNAKILLAEEKLFVTLRFLSSGMSVRECSKAFQLGRSTILKIVTCTLEAICEELSPAHYLPLNPPNLIACSQKFYQKWRFPNCIGAIGGKYVPLIKLKENVSVKKVAKYSLMLNAVVDADFKFLAVDVISDHQSSKEITFHSIFAYSDYENLPDSDIRMPLVLIGNAAYPLRNHLMRPYPTVPRTMNEEKAVFNDRLAKARVPVNFAFEILTEKWKVYSKPKAVSIAKATLTIKTTCLLNNIIRDIDGDRDPHFANIGKVDKGTIYLHLVEKRSKKNCRSAVVAMALRDNFTKYFMAHQPSS